MEVPPRVVAARSRAERLGFEYSCDDGTGRLLAVLAAAVREGGRILELGTGVGAGCAWIVHGLGPRTDVEVVSVEIDPFNASAAAEQSWPGYVNLRVGNALELLPSLGTFDLIFPDAPAGKWTGLDRTVAALRPGGVLVVDDMIPPPHFREDWKTSLERARENLLANPELIAVEIADLTGVILATKRIA
jgi:demethylmenaquinone methyltransferase/2-methoxy-6-polyprenyl-1,4-benzoquinol methylase